MVKPVNEVEFLTAVVDVFYLRGFGLSRTLAISKSICAACGFNQNHPQPSEEATLFALTGLCEGCQRFVIGEKR